MSYYLPPVIALVLAVLGITSAINESRKPEAPVVMVDLVSGNTIGELPVPPDGWRSPLVIFFYGMLGAASGGFFLLKYFLPRLSEIVGEIFYSPGERARMGPFEKAMALVTSGQPEKAAAAFRAIMDGGHPDWRAWIELARLQENEDGDGDAAIQTLEAGAARDWPPEEHARLLLRLGDVCGGAKQYRQAARHLQNLMRLHAGTPHAAAAAIKLQQFESEEYMGRAVG